MWSVRYGKNRYDPIGRNRLTRREPLWPINGLTPTSDCPHGSQIARGVVCGVRHCVARMTQQQIDRMACPEITDPETRIAEFNALIASGLLDSHVVERVNLHIKTLRAIINEMAGNPTRYRPDPRLKGGRG